MGANTLHVICGSSVHLVVCLSVFWWLIYSPWQCLVCI